MGITLKIFVIVLLFTLTTCNSNQENGESSDSLENDVNFSSKNKEGRSGMSIYNLGSSWKTHTGDTIQLKDLEGNIQVLAMAYTSCQFACPRILNDMERIKAVLEKEDLDDEVKYVLISFDPKVDTPEKLKEYAKKNMLSSNEWNLLNGNENDVLELAAVLGVKYKKISSKDYSHSNIITILDQHGEIAYQQEGLGQNPSRAVKVIENLSE